MAEWRSRIKLKDLLEIYDESKDEIEEIKRIKPIWVDRLKTIPKLEHFIKTLKAVKTETGFNKWLAKVYDYCNVYRIWVE